VRLLQLTRGGEWSRSFCNNQLTGAAFIGTVGLDWQFAGIAPVHSAGASGRVANAALNNRQIGRDCRSWKCAAAVGSFCQESRPRLYLIGDYSRRFAFTATLLVGSAKNRTAQAPSNPACAHPG
jgi:hypothetical protein